LTWSPNQLATGVCRWANDEVVQMKASRTWALRVIVRIDPNPKDDPDLPVSSEEGSLDSASDSDGSSTNPLIRILSPAQTNLMRTRQTNRWPNDGYTLIAVNM
jgi:hypothetical protein